MSERTATRRVRPLRTMIAVVMSAAIALLGMTFVPAQADTAPTSAGSTAPETVSADALPTWQLTGVVWSQVLVGNTVYATGNFTKARPAGVAAGGAGEITVSHLFAYDIRTGERIAGFTHTLNAQGLAITASPDGARVYVGGDFTAVDGKVRQHVAAFDTATGALVPTWAPVVNGQVKALAVTGSTVYVGGAFESAGGVARKRLAALSTSTGALQPWAPRADDGYVWSLVVTPDGSKVVAGGQFSTLSGAPVYGMGAVDAVTGATVAWAANAVIKDSGKGGINSLTSDGTYLYGSGFAFGAGGFFEGSFSLDPADGSIRWLVDCLGDTYDVEPVGEVVYTASHSHDCKMIGQFPDTGPRVRWQHAGAYTSFPTGVNNGPDAYKWNFKGQPAPSMLHWYPALGIGSATGQYQAAWNVVGNTDYVAMAGEFPTVNGKAQSALTRFAVKTKTINKVGPQYQTVPARTTPATTATALSAGGARVSFGTAWDKDNQNLSYEVYRDKGTPAQKLVTTVRANSTFWTLPTLTVSDGGAPAGTHTYQVRVTDGFGNEALSPVSNPVTVARAVTAYGARVIADGAVGYWRLGEASGTVAYDIVGGADGTRQAGMTFGAAGAIAGDSDSAAAFNGTSTGYLGAGGSVVAAPDAFTLEAWFKTTSTRGGKIIGFGSAKTGDSAKYDRHVYLSDNGKINFGVSSNGLKTLSGPTAYNDGAWHLATASVGSAGMSLSVDGQLVDADPTVTGAADYTGYWRVGGDTLTTGWPAAPTSRFLAGTIDDVAVYGKALSAAQVQEHYRLGGGTVPNVAPVAAFAATSVGFDARFDATGSTDTEGTIGTYAWDFGDGSTGTAATPTHRYAQAGTYPVSVTVTDQTGSTDTVSHDVTVTGLLARDAFARTQANGWGSADIGGAWTATGTSGLFAVGDGRATITMNAPGAGPSVRLGGVSSTATDLQVDIAFDKAPTGGGQFLKAIVRGDTSNGYAAKVWVSSTGVMTVYLTKIIAGVETDLVSKVISGVTSTAGQSYSVRVQASGTTPTALQAKLWRTADVEPSGWTITATDSTTALQTAGGIALRTYLSGSATSAPVTLSVTKIIATPIGA